MKTTRHFSVRGRQGFTLIELLTVIAIIGILASIIIPTVGYVQVKAKRSKTRIQFTQWAGAMEMFKQTYQAYPILDGNYIGAVGTQNKINTPKFFVALTGTTWDGVPLASGADVVTKAGNAKLKSFYQVGQNELNRDVQPYQLQDAFNNTDIAVIWDKNLDGKIDSTDGNLLPYVDSVGGGRFLPDPKVDIDMTLGVYIGVIFYDGGNGTSDGSEITADGAVFSNK